MENNQSQIEELAALQKEIRILQRKLDVKAGKSGSKVRVKNGETYVPIGFSGKRLTVLENLPLDEQVKLKIKRIKNLYVMAENYQQQVNRFQMMVDKMKQQAQELEDSLPPIADMPDAPDQQPEA